MPTWNEISKVLNVEGPCIKNALCWKEVSIVLVINIRFCITLRYSGIADIQESKKEILI